MQRGCEYLELAYLSFFEQFRKVYVGDTMQKNTVVYQTLTSHLGVVDETAIVNVIAQKMYATGSHFLDYLCVYVSLFL